ncbi:MAG: phosphatase, partial [Merismopedia sp. SIO2A8]|nr:phosphatase [Merismopedia sp. SIO2A8]
MLELLIDDIQTINSTIYVSGQLSSEQLETLPEIGIQSALCLRCASESGFRVEERSHLEVLGIQYHHVPLSSETLNRELITHALQIIDTLPKPVL